MSGRAVNIQPLSYRFGQQCTEQTEERHTVLWTDRLCRESGERLQEVEGQPRLKLKEGLLIEEFLAKCMCVCECIFLLRSMKPAAEAFLNRG